MPITGRLHVFLLQLGEVRKKKGGGGKKDNSQRSFIFSGES